MYAIEWRHYQIILAIQNTGSLTGAARSVNVTQSAATHQVKEAERRLGVELVRRHGRSLKLTAAGLAIADAAAACAPLMHQAENKARELSHTHQSRLRIAFGVQDGLGWAAGAARFLSETIHPIQLDLVHGGRRAPSQTMRLGEADLAVEIGEAAFPESKRYSLGRDELVCIVSPSALLAKKKSLTPQDIAAETYLAHSLVLQPGFEFEAFFLPADSRPQHVAQVESLQAILQLVAAGQGVSIQPRSAVADAAARKLVRALPLSPEPVFQPWYLHARAEAVAEHGDVLLTELAWTISNTLSLSV